MWLCYIPKPCGRAKSYPYSPISLFEFCRSPPRYAPSAFYDPLQRTVIRSIRADKTAGDNEGILYLKGLGNYKFLSVIRRSSSSLHRRLYTKEQRKF